MGHHQKAASCSAVPSFGSFTSVSTTPPNSINHRSCSSPAASKQLFPLPSFCLYSKRALANEYAPESDIVQFLAPSSSILQERLPLFVGVLQSLFTVVSDMPFVDKDQSEENVAVEAENEYTEELEEEEEGEKDETHRDSFSPFTIIGLNSMKLVIWSNMCDHVTDSITYDKDLCLVIFVSAHIIDGIILQNMNLLKESLFNSLSNVTANQLGDQLMPLVKYWFEEGQ